MTEPQEPTKILLVEDEPLVRIIGADVLEDAGYQVIEAENAAQAVEALHGTADIKVLFTDIRMPGEMDGLQLAQLVHERWPHVKLLVASGHHHLQDGDIPDDGRFLQKPYRSQAMLQDIKEMLAGLPSNHKLRKR